MTGSTSSGWPGGWPRKERREQSEPDVYLAVDQHGRVIDVLVPAKRDLAAVRCFFSRALRTGTIRARALGLLAPLGRRR
jgi:hypothetical protein